MADGARTRKVAVVNGGGSVVGGPICVRLAREGWVVAVWDPRFGAALSAVAEIEKAGGEAVALEVDALDAEAAVRAAILTVAEWGAPALVVNCGVAGASVADQAAFFAACIDALTLGPGDVRERVVVNAFHAVPRSGEERSEIATSTEALARRLAAQGVRVNALLGVDFSATEGSTVQRTPSEREVWSMLSRLCSPERIVETGAILELG